MKIILGILMLICMYGCIVAGGVYEDTVMCKRGITEYCIE